MPSRMQKDLERKSTQGSIPQAPEHTFKPKIGQPKTAEMFKAMQQKFED